MAEKIRDYTRLASDIIREVGGKGNISNVARCATRLRLVLRETPKGAKDRVGNLAGVITVVENGGQFQVVIGTHVGEVFEQVAKELNLEAGDAEQEDVKQGIGTRVVAMMSAVFAPFVYALAAGGLLQGVLIIIKTFAPDVVSSGTFQVFDLMSWAPFTFLPIFIALTASKYFKCNQVTAILCCMALVSPSLTELVGRVAAGEGVSLFGFSLASTVYTSTVLPPLFLVWVLSHVERLVKKFVPDVTKALLTPLISYIIMVPLMLLLVGPASEFVANGIATGYKFLSDKVPVLTAAIVGGVWQVFVIFGVHWGITPVILADFAQNGSNTFQAYQTCAVVAQVGAAFGVFLKSRNKELKNMSLSAGITGIFGITEPTIYGVTLRLKKPFICACVAGAVGAVAASFFQTTYYVYAGLPGLLTVINAITPGNYTPFTGMLVGAAIAVVGAALLVQVIGFDDPVAENCAGEGMGENGTAGGNDVGQKMAGGLTGGTVAGQGIAGGLTGGAVAGQGIADGMDGGSAAGQEAVYSPMAGTVIPLSEVKDAVFSGGTLGPGFAIEPEAGRLCAPADGTVSMLFDTLHAVGLTTGHGTELMMHVGMDTVKLNGQYFKAFVKQGDEVKRGDLLLEFDLDKIRAAGYDTVTPVVMTNCEKPEGFLVRKYGNVQMGSQIAAIEQ